MPASMAYGRFRSALLLVLPLALSPVARAAKEAPQGELELEAERFLRHYSPLMVSAATEAAEASWAAAVDATPEREAARLASRRTLDAVLGSPFVLEQTRRFLERRKELPPRLVRELEKAQLAAVDARLERSGGQPAPLNPAGDLDRILRESLVPAERLRAWNGIKETSGALKPGLAALRDRRNEAARSLGYSSFYALQASDYGLTVAEMDALLGAIVRDVQPLYRKLHCWAKHELARRYGQPAPKGPIPAHWLPDRWGQGWPGLAAGPELAAQFKGRSREWVIRQAERFYRSMGFPELSESFWTRSDLYPVPPGSPRRKSSGPSAWHVDLDRDARALLNVEPDARSFAAAHRELAHVYYYLAYSRPEIPPLLRAGANRAFHEGIAGLLELAANQPSALSQAGLVPKSQKTDLPRRLLHEALDDAVVFLPWAAGVVPSFERGLYEETLPVKKWNKRWWEEVGALQGIAPPAPRGESFCDGCAKAHVLEEPARYYDYAIAAVLKHQLHDHICREILEDDVHDCRYHGSKEAGKFLQSMMAEGATRDWRELLREKTGKDLSALPLLDYFAPLGEFLDKENAGRACSWP